MRAPTSTSSRLTLIEIVVSVGLLAVILLGVVATISSSQLAQSNTKERLAASLAAGAKLDEIASFARTPAGFDDLVASYHQTGFEVNHAPGEVGLVPDGSSAAIDLLPAAPASFPPSRAFAAPAVQDLPGYVEVDPVPGRTDLVDVTVTVAWRSVAGHGADERLVNSLRITR